MTFSAVFPSRSLRPPVLEERGLPAALEDQAAIFRERTGISCETDFTPLRLDHTIETVLYRVAQEALANVAKHSGGARAEVRLRREGDRAVLEISDDGIGFDIQRKSETLGLGHLGLVSMRERVELAGGVWSLVSSPGKGTRIKVDFDRNGGIDARVAASALAH
jgi:two-component system, NarL family, sensor kinase